MPKISTLTTKTTPEGTDLVPIVDMTGTPTTKKVTITSIAALAGGGGGDETNALTITTSPSGSLDMTSYGHLDANGFGITVRGVVAPSAGKAKRFTIHNNGDGVFLILKNEDASVAAANRFFIAAGADLSIDSGDTYVATYSQNHQRWLIAKAGDGGEVNTASNVGTGTGQVYRSKTGVNIDLKTIKAGANVTVANNADDVTIAAAGITLPGTANQLLTSNGSGGASATTTTLTNTVCATSINQTDRTNTAGAAATDTHDVIAEQSTTNATTTTIYTIALPNNAVTTIDIRVTACKSDSSSADAWVGSATFKQASGTAATVQAASITHRGATAWSVTITLTGTTAYIQVTGAASTTIKWGANITWQVTRQS